MKVLATSVVRSAHKGESHGAVYLIDLQSATSTQVVDWGPDIDWQGRGLDRGLRGIAFHGGLTYIAASHTILAYDAAFNIVETFTNPYLRHCHEIDIAEDTLWVTSTGCDALLACDLKRKCFTHAFCLRYSPVKKMMKKLFPVGLPAIVSFDPTAGDGLQPADTLHLNTVVVREGVVYCSGTGLNCLMRMENAHGERYARLPFGTHNARPYRDGVLMNDTKNNTIRYTDRSGQLREQWFIPSYAESVLLNNHLPQDYARQGFGRGLCPTDDGTIIAGSSPATVSVYAHGDPKPKQSVILSTDVRYAIHGLEVYPY